MTPAFESDVDRINGKPRKGGKLPELPKRGDLDELRDWLTLAFKPADGYRVDAFDRYGRRDPDPCALTLRRGRDTTVYRFPTQAELQGRRLWRTIPGISDGLLDMPKLNDGELYDVWKALCRLGRVAHEIDDRDETRKWIEHLLDDAAPLRGQTLVPDGRHDGLMAIRQLGEFKRHDALAMLHGDPTRRPVRFIDAQTGEQWVRAGEAATFIRYVVGVEPLAPSTLRGRLDQIGVEWRPFEDRRPPHPKAKMFRLTDDLIEYVDGHLPEPEQAAMPF